jgi:hypothetical protein
LSVDLQGGSCGDWRRQGYPHLSSGRPNRAIRRSDAHHEAVACGGLHQISAGRARTHASTTNRECFGNRHSAGCPERSGPGEIDRTGRIGGGAFGNRASSLKSTSISGIPKRRGCAAIRGGAGLLQHRSPGRLLEEEALALLQRAAPFPPPPAEVPGKDPVDVTVPIRFNLTQPASSN